MATTKRKAAPKAKPAAKKASSLATFEVYQDPSRGWRWRLIHRNKNIIADSSEAYETRAKVLIGVRSVKTNAADASVVTLKG